MMNEALELLKHNLSVIPVGPDKKPLIKWLPYQGKRASEEEIRAWWGKYPNANIGIVTGRISNLTVIDCDSNEAASVFREIYKGTTVTAKTPRGTHYYIQYVEGTRNTVKIKGTDLDLRSEAGYVVAPPSVNDKGEQYRWIKSIKDHSPDSLNSILAFLYKGGVDSEYSERRQTSTMSTNVDKWFKQGTRDNDLFHVANCLVKGHAEPELIKYVLEMLAENCTPPFSEKEIEAKIKSAIERAKRKERNLAQEIEEYVMSTTGVFMSTDVNRCIQLSTRQELQNSSVILRRMCEKGIIEKVGEKNGCWRKVENDLDVIDWKNADTEEYKINLPLNIHNLVKIYPGNIIVLAGASNTGKTSFLLETIRLNQRHQKIRYLNSEMGASELRLRLEMFHEICPVDKWKFEAIERSDKFADAIDPDAFNVIDFMEIYDEFWRLGGWIRDVHKKLNKGIAVIAIQKKSNTKKDQNDFGRGGELTIEKPRLYLAMDRGKIKIVKAKIWRSREKNPNGLIRRFKLVSGWKFLPNDEWMNEDEDQRFEKHSKYAEYGITDEVFPHED